MRRRIAGLLSVSALSVGSTLVAGAVSPAAAVNPIPQGELTGTVTGPTGAAMPGVAVHVTGDTDNDGDYDDFDERQETGFAGDYHLNHLMAGKYKLGFVASGYVEEYYDNAADIDAATPIVVGTGGVAVPPVSLAAAAPVVVDADTDVTGVVTDVATGQPISGIEVVAYDAVTGFLIDRGDTDLAGRYEIDDVEELVSVKLGFSDGNYGGGDLAYLPMWSGGAKVRAAASAVALTPGAPVTVAPALVRSAGITGRVLNPTGRGPMQGSVQVYDADSAVVTSAATRPDGTYYVGGLNPGEEYRVVFSDAYDYPGVDYEADITHYFDQWYVNGNSFESATPVTGASGSWTTGIGATLRDSLVALEQPSISGDFVVGKTLTAGKGRWNRNGNSAFSYEWLRGSTVVGTASTYTLAGADAGQGVALRVTITNYDHGRVRTLSATTPAAVAKYSSAVSAKAKKVKKGKNAGTMEVTVSVKAGAQAAASTTGTVKVTEGKKKVATLKLKNGKATFLVKKAGKHTLELAYSGNGTTLPDDGEVTVKVKSKKK